MDIASAKGHLDIYKFLHENRSEGFINFAMDWASANDHSQIIEFLQNI